MEVTITKEDFANATYFESGASCPLTKALQRIGIKDAYCSGYTHVKAGEKIYTISGFSEKLRYATSIEKDEFRMKIDGYIEAAKAGQDVPEYHVKLTEVVHNTYDIETI